MHQLVGLSEVRGRRPNNGISYSRVGLPDGQLETVVGLHLPGASGDVFDRISFNTGGSVTDPVEYSIRLLVPNARLRREAFALSGFLGKPDRFGMNSNIISGFMYE